MSLAAFILFISRGQSGVQHHPCDDLLSLLMPFAYTVRSMRVIKWQTVSPLLWTDGLSREKANSPLSKVNVLTFLKDFLNALTSPIRLSEHMIAASNVHIPLCLYKPHSPLLASMCLIQPALDEPPLSLYHVNFVSSYSNRGFPALCTLHAASIPTNRPESVPDYILEISIPRFSTRTLGPCPGQSSASIFLAKVPCMSTVEWRGERLTRLQRFVAKGLNRLVQTLMCHFRYGHGPSIHGRVGIRHSALRSPPLGECTLLSDPTSIAMFFASKSVSKQRKYPFYTSCSRVSHQPRAARHIEVRPISAPCLSTLRYCL